MTKNTVELLPTDTLEERAEKIVDILGFSGAVGNHTWAVYRALKYYHEIDKETYGTANETDLGS